MEHKGSVLCMLTICRRSMPRRRRSSFPPVGKSGLVTMSNCSLTRSQGVRKIRLANRHRTNVHVTSAWCPFCPTKVRCERAIRTPIWDIADKRHVSGQNFVLFVIRCPFGEAFARSNRVSVRSINDLANAQRTLRANPQVNPCLITFASAFAVRSLDQKHAATKRSLTPPSLGGSESER
jgi:hypothetical protein